MCVYVCDCVCASCCELTTRSTFHVMMLSYTFTIHRTMHFWCVCVCVDVCASKLYFTSIKCECFSVFKIQYEIHIHSAFTLNLCV